jgi:hypothetical protein
MTEKVEAKSLHVEIANRLVLAPSSSRIMLNKNEFI